MTDKNEIKLDKDATAVIGDNNVVAASNAIIIHGDNNFIQTISGDNPDAAESLREVLQRYLNWVIETNSFAYTAKHLKQTASDFDIEHLLPFAVTYESNLAKPQKGLLDHSVDLAANLLNPDELLQLDRHLIVTGALGSGKTSFLQQIALTFAFAIGFDQPTNLLSGPRGLSKPLPLPIFLPLKAYAAYLYKTSSNIGAEDRTIYTFVAQYLTDRHFSPDLPADIYTRLLKHVGNIIFLLDGLDEIRSLSERTMLIQVINDLSKVPNLRIIVSCRSGIGHGLSSFTGIHIQPMQRKHINSYLVALCAHINANENNDTPLLPGQVQQGWAACLEEFSKHYGSQHNGRLDRPLIANLWLQTHLNEQSRLNRKAVFLSTLTSSLITSNFGEVIRSSDSGQNELTRANVSRILQIIAYQSLLEGEIRTPILEDTLFAWATRAGFGSQIMREFCQAVHDRDGILIFQNHTYSFFHPALQTFLAGSWLASTLRREDDFDYWLKEKIADLRWHNAIVCIVGYDLAQGRLDEAKRVILYLIGSDSFNRSLLASFRWSSVTLAVRALSQWHNPPSSLRARIEALVLNCLTEEQKRREKNRFLRLAEKMVLPSNAHTISPQTRAQLGLALNGLPDFRSGVGWTDNRVPDLAWGKSIQSGQYLIGRNDNADSCLTARIVDIASPFSLACYPITFAQYMCFIEAPDFEEFRWWHGMPSQDYPSQAREIIAGAWQYDNHPCVHVSWYHAIAFSRWLSGKLGYQVHLPTEYQWEIAARYPDQREYPWGDVFDENVANTDELGLEGTTAVGLFPAGRNRDLALYDLSGNVWEWCISEFNNPDISTNIEHNTARTLRGGSWQANKSGARVTSRDYAKPTFYNRNIGFRLCRLRDK